MSDILTAEQIAELEALLAADNRFSTHVMDHREFVRELCNAAPALIAMAKQAAEADDILRRFFDTFMPMKVETVQQCCDALAAKSEIDKLKQDLEHWRQEVGKLNSVLDSLQMQGINQAQMTEYFRSNYVSERGRAKETEAEAGRYREMAVSLARSLEKCADNLQGYYSGANYELARKLLEDPDIAALLSEEKDK